MHHDTEFSEAVTQINYNAPDARAARARRTDTTPQRSEMRAFAVAGLVLVAFVLAVGWLSRADAAPLYVVNQTIDNQICSHYFPASRPDARAPRALSPRRSAASRSYDSRAASTPGSAAETVTARGQAYVACLKHSVL